MEGAARGHQDTGRLEAGIKSLEQSLVALGDRTDFVELLKIIHRPGWTTPAEALLVSGVVDAMLAHVKVLTSLKQALLTGSRAVGTKQ